MPDSRVFTVARFITDADGFFGVPSYVAAGAFSSHSPTETLTVDAARDVISAWLEAPLPVPPPSPVPTVLDSMLKEWTTAEAYEVNGAVARNANLVPTSFAVRWPDGSSGVFTTTANDATTGAINAFTITHDQSGKTVTQPAVTRGPYGAVTSKPLLTVA